jgi:Domain of unknown function (DUF4350)
MMAFSNSKPSRRGSDRRIVLIILGIALLGIAGVSIVAPATGDTDPTPSSYNSGSAGGKALFLLMSAMGYDAVRWDSPPADLDNVDAAHTTIILAEPDYPTEDGKQIQAEVAKFIARGGHVLATGRSGAYLLPGGSTAPPTQLYKALCQTTPESKSVSDPLAQTGNVTLPDYVRWNPDATTIYDSAHHAYPVTVSQRCGDDAVVVSFPYGAGQAIWWNSPMPLTNAGLKEDPSLKLVLASLVPAGSAGKYRILFDEYFHGDRATLWESARGLPINQLLLQVACVAALLVLSFGRRSGPLRKPLQVPRTSPIEFAESMGRLYRSANATRAATGAARRRLLQFLSERCGVPREILHANSPDAVVGALQARLPGDWSRVGAHLAQAAAAEHSNLAPRSALELVLALDHDQRDLAAAIQAVLPVPQSTAA